MVRREAAKRVVQAGGYFFILQISAAVAYQSDTLVVAQILGSSAVPEYAVPMKLFLLGPTLLSFVFTPLWPAYAEALARGDREWSRVTLVRSLVLALAAAVPSSALLALVGKPLIHFWVGDAVQPTYLLLVAMASWSVVMALTGALSAFLNGAHILRFQAVCAVLMMTANIALSIALTLRVGVSGVVWGSLIAQLVFVIVPSGVYLARLLRPSARAGGAAA